MRRWRQLAAGALAALMLGGMAAAAVPVDTYAIVDTSDNEYIKTRKTPTGKTGKSMTVSFVFENNSGVDLSHVKVGFSQSTDIDETDEDVVKYGWLFPFEIEKGTFEPKDIGTVADGKSKSVSITAKVRRDIPDGYYSIPIAMSAQEGGNTWSVADEYINVWISKSTSSDSDTDDSDSGAISFVLGENQNTPSGTYPNVMNFSVNMRNESTTSAFDVNASMVLSPKDEEFPFEINEANYDRRFEKIEAGQTVSLDYSMAIRKDVYSGYYPIKVNVNYRDSMEGDVKKAETAFYVNISNKEREEDSKGDFNANDRTKARIIVDSYETIPAEIYAGEEFELVVRMKNASASVPASNILFTFESEKVSDSAVFSTESGSSSSVVNQLGAGQTAEIRMKLVSRAGVDQRSYGITIKEKYDSPEFKNAEESISIDIPVKQRARLSTGTVEVMPQSITVGSESNVMFGINNTGKVMLYNVTAAFEADSIQNTDAYVGNIKPGETGNVDVMLTGVAPTMDDGKVRIAISYEDENGAVTVEEKELSLVVTEEMPPMDEEMFGDFDMEEPEEGFWQKYRIPAILAGAAAVVAILVAVAVIRKKKKALNEDLGDWEEKEENEDEIS